MNIIPAPDLHLAAAYWPPQVVWPGLCYERTVTTVCVHEAGHLCASLAEDLTIHRQLARIHVHDGWISGSVEKYDREGCRLSKPGAVVSIHQDPDIPEPDPHLGSRIVAWAGMFLAGFAAEALLHGYAEKVTGWPAPMLNTADMANAIAFLSIGWPHQLGGPLWCAWRHALHLLSRQWGWVLRVAAEIEHAGECSSELAAVLAGECRSELVPPLTTATH
jgi:hypothetical protein